jgi:NitT/TauT family transport system substrate-binding protein
MMRFSRRDVLKVGVAGALALGPAAPAAWARSSVKGTQVTTVLYAGTLIAEAGGYFKREGLDIELLNSPAGARSAQMLAAGQVHFIHGDASHPQRLTEQGKPTTILFATDKKCPYANITVRKDLWDAGLTSIDKLATMKPKSGEKWKIGCTSVGSGTWMYGNFILRSRALGPGKTLNDLAEWIGVGAPRSALGAMKTGKIDMHIAVAELIVETEAQGIGKLLFDVRDDAQWTSVFKGPIAATCGYALRTTIQTMKDETQAYVTAVYKAQQWIKSASAVDIARGLERYQDGMGMSTDTIATAVEWYKPVWTYDMTLTRENYDNGLNVAKGLKSEKTYPYEEIVDESFLRRASGRA